MAMIAARAAWVVPIDENALRITTQLAPALFVGLLARIDTRTDAPELVQLRSGMLDGRALDIQGVEARRG
jgi:hypothetical protein